MNLQIMANNRPSLFFILFVLMMIKAVWAQTEWPLSNGTYSNDTNTCLASCEQCGENSARCIFNPIKCTVKCECKVGFTGDVCSESESLFHDLKNTTWREILASTSVESIGRNATSLYFEDLFKKLYNLFDAIRSQNDFQPDDIHLMSIYLRNLAHLNRNRFNLNEPAMISLLRTIDLIIKLNQRDPVLTRANQSALDIFTLLDDLTPSVRLKKNTSFQVKLSNFEFLLVEGLNEPLRFSSPPVTGRNITLIDSISLDEQVLKQYFNNRSIKIAFKIFFNYETSSFKSDFHQQLKDTSRNFFYEITQPGNFVSSNVLSAVIYDKDVIHQAVTGPNLVRLQFLVDLKRFTLGSHLIRSNLACVFWNSSQSSWSRDGCTASEDESQLRDDFIYQKVCYCDHLTNFALLFDDRRLTEPGLFGKFLTILTYVGISVSCMCYLILIFNRICCHWSSSMTGNRQNYQDSTLKRLYIANAVCLLVSNVLFLFVLEIKPSLGNLNACLATASLLHYFLLASFCFSFATAWHHYTKLVKIFDNYRTSGFFSNHILTVWTVFSLLFSLVFAIVGYQLQSSFDPRSIIDSNNCWLKKPHLYFLFVVPISVLLLLSLLLYIFVTVKVLSIYSCIFDLKILCREKVKKDEAIRANCVSSSYNNKRVIVLLSFSFISLGLTWLIGLFIVISAHISPHLKLLMDFLFCLSNSFHGLCLLIGNFLAKKYSKSGSFSSASFTKTIVNPTTTTTNTATSSSDEGQNEKRRLSLMDRLCLYTFGLGYVVSSNCCRSDNGLNGHKNLDHNNKTPFLEFTIVNRYNNEDSNESVSNGNFNTVQTNMSELFRSNAGWIQKRNSTDIASGKENSFYISSL